MTRRALLLLVVALAITVGAVRDFVFVNLNYQIDFLEFHRRVSYAHSLFQDRVKGWDLEALLLLKWFLSAAFIAAMLLLCVLFSHLLTGDHRHARSLVLLYAIAAAVALLLHFSGPAIGSGPGCAFVAVRLLHALQYPVPLLFIWAAHHLPRRA